MIRPRTLHRARTIALAALGIVAASTLLGGPAVARTDEAPSIGGLKGTAHSSGMHLYYNPQGVLPTAAPVDFGVPDALATVSSGPVTFARASVADPGDLLANPDALLSQADARYPQGAIPAYPFRISANSSVGEAQDESKPAPGLEARVEATPEGSTSESRTAASSAPGAASVGSLRSLATTTFDGSTVQVHAHTEVTDFDFLGLLEIDSIITDVVATSSGGDVALDGGTRVSGATFMDRPVIIDEDGIRTDPDAEQPDAPLLGAVSDALPADLTTALADAGIRISLPGPVQQEGGSTGMLGTTGLRIELELSEENAPALGQLFDALPPLDNPVPGAPGPADAIVLLRATHLTAMDVGRAQVALETQPAFVPPPFEPSVDVGAGFDVSAAPTPALSPPIARSPEPAPSTVSPSPATTPAAGTPAASLGAGIGALALLALLAQPFIGDRIARLGSAVLAPGAAGACPLQEVP